MATHTTLPIYKAAYDLLGLSSDMVKNMNRDYKRTIGEKIAMECIEITVLVFRANVEVRFEAKKETIDVLDGYCSATGKCRTAFINDLLEQWANAKLYEATIVCRVAGINPTLSDAKGKP